MKNTLKAFEILVSKEAGQEELVKVLSGLYYNYSQMMIRNALKKNDATEIPINAADELYWINRLIQVLDGSYEISEVYK